MSRRLDPGQRARDFPTMRSPRLASVSMERRLATVERQVTSALSLATQPQGTTPIETLDALPEATSDDLGRQIIVSPPGTAESAIYVGTLMPDGTVLWQRQGTSAFVDFTYVRGMVPSGSSDGQSSALKAVAFSPDGDSVYVADDDFAGVRIQQLTVATGGFVRKWGTAGTGNGQFNSTNSIGGLACDDTGDVYATDVGNHRVQRFSSTGTYEDKVGTVGSGTSQFSFPTGIAVDANRNIYISDNGNDRVKKHDGDGTSIPYITQWGTAGTGDGQFQAPNAIACDDANVYVIDSVRKDIQKFTNTGTFLTKWSLTTTIGDVGTPQGIACYDRFVFVGEYSEDRIQIFTKNGAYAGSFLPGTNDIQDLAISAGGVLAIAQGIGGTGARLRLWLLST